MTKNDLLPCEPMLKHIEKFERVINVTLLLMLALVVVLATIDLGWIIVKDMLTPTGDSAR